MKNLSRIISVFLLLIFKLAGAQELPKEAQEHLFYGGLHMQALNYGQIGIDFFYLSPKGHGLHYSSSYYSKMPETRPADYQSCSWFFPTELYDEANIDELRYQYQFAKPNHRIRFLVEAGMSYNQFSLVEYEKRVPTAICYYSSHSKRSGFGFSTRLTVDFPIFRGTGLQLSMNTNINSIRNISGLELTWTFGRVRNKF